MPPAQWAPMPGARAAGIPAGSGAGPEAEGPRRKCSQDSIFRTRAFPGIPVSSREMIVTLNPSKVFLELVDVRNHPVAHFQPAILGTLVRFPAWQAAGLRREFMVYDE